MIVPGSANALMLGQSSATGYNLTNSLRFRSSASAYLNRTIASNGSATTWTYSTWMKRGTLGTAQDGFIEARVDGSNNTEIAFTSSDTLAILAFNGGSTVFNLTTTQVFRDPSAWYHFIIAVDTTQATSSNRVKLYVNGTQVTAFSTSTYPSQNATTYMSQTSATHNIGRWPSPTQYFDGYLAETIFVDGQQLTPSSFGENNADTGVWQPKRYTGTYGTNGFYLPFTDTTSTTTLGYDSSGNGNNWTTNNISLTAGNTYDSMTDVPTLTDASTANYCVLNPVAPGDYFASGQSTLALTNGNLSYGSTGRNAFGSMAVSSGKWYWEFSNTSNTSSASTLSGLVTVAPRASVYGVYYNSSNGNKGLGTLNSGATETSYGATWTDNDIIGVALNMDAATPTVTFYKNNSSQGSISVSAFVGQTVFAWMQNGANSNNMSGWFNFGQQPFAYTPPTGYVALNTYNLPTSTIVKGNTVMDATLYTSNGGVQTVTNTAGFKPDFVWIKDRSSTASHDLMDSVRGASKYLFSNTTGAEVTDANFLTSFNSNGFSLGSSNYNGGDAFVGWQWQAGQGTTSSNTNGSITSTVSVNATAGFSIVTYTTPASGVYTVGHGLGVAPSLIINKARSTTGNWLTWHIGLTGGAGNTNTYVALNLTDAQATSGSQIWSAPTSTTFGCNSGVSVANNADYVAYCWSEIAGFSKFGSYTGNGSTDGPFVYTGFRPKFVLIKSSSNVENWHLHDTSRDTYNLASADLYPDSSSAEVTAYNQLDILSNGFKCRSTNTGTNGSGYTFIYMAFAENPFKNALAR